MSPNKDEFCKSFGKRKSKYLNRKKATPKFVVLGLKIYWASPDRLANNSIFSKKVHFKTFLLFILHQLFFVIIYTKNSLKNKLFSLFFSKNSKLFLII
jgi:hypothetical protein